MAQLQGTYDPNAHAPLADFTVLPKGQYNVAIKGDEWKECKGGHMLVVSFVVLDGPHAGVELSDNFTLAVAEQKNVDMAQRKLGMICRAVNYLQALNDTNVLHGKPLTVRTDVRFYEKQDGSQGSSTDIKKYEPYVGANMASGPDAVQPTPPAPAAQAPAIGGLSAPGGLRLPTATPAMAVAPQAPAAAAPVGMPAGFALPGQNTLGAPTPAVPAQGGFPGMPTQAPGAVAAPPPGAPMFRLPGQ